MVKQIGKIVSIFILIILISMFMQNFSTVFAYDWTEELEFVGSDHSSASGVAEVDNLLTTIVYTVKLLATGVALTTIIVIAVKYMMAAPGEKAEIKKHAVPYVVGAVILYASATIIGIIADFAGVIE